MNSSPFVAEQIEICVQTVLYESDFLLRKSKVFAQLRRSARLIQEEYRLASVPNNVHVCRAMIVRINHDPQTIRRIVGIKGQSARNPSGLE